jgi:hypothetical protein
MFELRNALLAAYLDGEPASVAILNDFLLEQGEDHGKLHGSVEQRMRVVLGLIRADLSHRLGCDFAEHVADLYSMAYPDDSRVQELIEMKRRWLWGEADLDQLKKARKPFLDSRGVLKPPLTSSTRVRVSGLIMYELWPAAQHVFRCAFLASTLSKTTARDCCAEAARAASRTPKPLGRSGLQETQWQIERVRHALLSAEIESF